MNGAGIQWVIKNVKKNQVMIGHQCIKEILIASYTRSRFLFWPTKGMSNEYNRDTQHATEQNSQYNN